MHRGDARSRALLRAPTMQRTLLPAGLIARPMAAMAVGLALAEGRIDSLDAPVSRYLTEWEDEPRGRITLRQLLEETSGLEDRRRHRMACCTARPGTTWRGLPAFATAQGRANVVRQRFRVERARFQAASTSPAVSTTSRRPTRSSPRSSSSAPPACRTRNIVDERLWRAVGAGQRASCKLDRRAGMPAAHCCWRATARDMLRILGLLATDGTHHGERAYCPRAGFSEMARPSRVNAETGLQVRALDARGREVARRDRRQWQRLLGDSAASAHHRQHRHGPAVRRLPELPALLMRV